MTGASVSGRRIQRGHFFDSIRFECPRENRDEIEDVLNAHFMDVTHSTTNFWSEDAVGFATGSRWFSDVVLHLALGEGLQLLWLMGSQAFVRARRTLARLASESSKPQSDNYGLNFDPDLIVGPVVFVVDLRRDSGVEKPPPLAQSWREKGADRLIVALPYGVGATVVERALSNLGKALDGIPMSDIGDGDIVVRFDASSRTWNAYPNGDIHRFRTILFTDVEDSTGLTSHLGDSKARELLREHEQVLRASLSAYGGKEIKTMGDGFMVAFFSASSALDAAIAMQRTITEHFAERETSIRIRVGINAGEPIEEDNDLYGASVIRAARVMGQAQGGEILVSNVVRELVEGKEYAFSDRGEADLKGFEKPVRLFEVRWDD